LNDEFAKSFGAENLEKLREGVRKDLENELTYKLDNSVRNQVIRALMDKVTLSCPARPSSRRRRTSSTTSSAKSKTRRRTRDHREGEGQIYAAAAQNAKERVKRAFLFRKIAEKEDIKVANEEVLRRVHTLAGAYQVEPKKFLQDLQKKNGLIEIYDQLANEKVVELLHKSGNHRGSPGGFARPRSSLSAVD